LSPVLVVYEQYPPGQSVVFPPSLSANASTLAKETSDNFSPCVFKFTLNTIVVVIAKAAILPRIIFFHNVFLFKNYFFNQYQSYIRNTTAKLNFMSQKSNYRFGITLFYNLSLAEIINLIP
jgi:hypothetical protein